MGLGKSKCDVPNCTIQGWVCLLLLVTLLYHYLFLLIFLCMRTLEFFKKKSLKYKAKNGYNLHLEDFEKNISLQ
jgi:hypothetical protein